MIKFHATGNCPIRDVLSRLGDKWSMLVLVTLEANGTMRFRDIHAATDADGDVADVGGGRVGVEESVCRGAPARGVSTDGDGREPDASYPDVGRVGDAAYAGDRREQGKTLTRERFQSDTECQLGEHARERF